MAVSEVVSQVEVFRSTLENKEVDGKASVIEVINTDTDINEHHVVTNIIDVVREQILPFEVEGPSRGVDVFNPDNSVVNIGAGPSLPENPYEGQVWIKT